MRGHVSRSAALVIASLASVSPLRVRAQAAPSAQEVLPGTRLGGLDSVVSVEIIDSRRRGLGQPTEGVIVGDGYYYSADAQFASFENGKIYPLSRLRDVVILKAPLAPAP